MILWRVVLKGSDAVFNNVHRRRRRAALKSDYVSSGQNAENAPLKDNLYQRCQQCGFICHPDRDLRMPEGSRSDPGISITERTTWGDDYGGIPWGGNTEDIEITAGCPLCGSLSWR